jgi:hypothetical protein
MEFWLLAKIATAVSLVEKFIFGATCVVVVSSASRYIKDYKSSVQEEALLQRGDQ